MKKVLNNKKENILINISFSTIIKISLFIILLYLLFYLKELVLVFLTAIVLSSAIEPIIKRMGKIKIPRVFAVTLVYLFLIFLISWISILIVPSLMEQANNFMKELPWQIDILNNWLDKKVSGNGVLSAAVDQIKDKISTLSGSISQNDQIIKSNTEGIFEGLVLGLFGGLLNFILVLVFSFYLAVQEHGIEKFLRIIIPVKYNKYAINLWKRTQKKISLWMQGQLLLGVIIGTITYFGLKVFFEFEQALLLAFLAAIAELIPIVGPFIAWIPAVIIAIMNNGWELAIWVSLFYLLVQMIENQFIYPLVVKKIVGVPSVLVILALIIGIQLFGFLGGILAIPVAAALMEYIKDVDKRQMEALKSGEEKEVDLSKKK